VGLSGAVAAVARTFRLGGEITGIAAVPGGHINQTYRVDVRGGEGETRSLLLQRLNTEVFRRPDLVMDNVARVTRHVALAARAAGRPSPLVPLVLTDHGAEWLADPTGGVWRMFRFVTGAVSRERAQSAADCEAAGRAFGELLVLLADWEEPALHETIPGFHDTRARLAQLAEAVRIDVVGRAAAARAETAAIEAARGLADVLPPLLATGAVPVRVAHNDAKLANVLLDARTGHPVCIVDLDTVMPGSALYDFGDLVRSTVSSAAEDEADPSRVSVKLDYFAALTRGYLATAGAVLTPVERSLLAFAGPLLTLEQAARFLSDHLAGDVYYRTTRPGQNLSRARSQLALLRSLTDQASALEVLVTRLASPAAGS
jgi:aminoglycoside phosphotransferase (APT) family kinase protein